MTGRMIADGSGWNKEAGMRRSKEEGVRGTRYEDEDEDEDEERVYLLEV
jgi:hypothetical protein